MKSPPSKKGRDCNITPQTTASLASPAYHGTELQQDRGTLRVLELLCVLSRTLIEINQKLDGLIALAQQRNDIARRSTGEWPRP